MIDLRAFEKNPDDLRQKLLKRGNSFDLDEVFSLLKDRRNLISRVQAQQEARNIASQALRSASAELIEEQRHSLKNLSQELKSDEGALRELEEKIDGLCLKLPNIPRADVPFGIDESANVEKKKVLEPRVFDFAVRDHIALGELSETIDFERAAKVSGARFTFLRGEVSRLNRALANFFLDYHVERGDLEISPPFMVHEAAMVGTGQFPKLKDDTFQVANGDSPYFLIPTAEVPLTNYYANEILDESQLPLRLIAYSPCFRAEAGAAGRDTRGLIRQHQFEKVEMVRFATEDQADAELEAMVARASDLLSRLELPHRVVTLCSGDLGFFSEKTYDLEVWLPGQNCYREISSCSVYNTYQSRRANIKYRPVQDASGKKSKPLFVHTLNGSGLPLGRTLVAILENHQNKDGSVSIPKALLPYMQGIEKISVKTAAP